MITCKTCELIARRDTGKAPDWDCIPRSPDLPREQHSVRIFACLGVPEEERVSEVEMNRLAVILRERLLAGKGLISNRRQHETKL